MMLSGAVQRGRRWWRRQSCPRHCCSSTARRFSGRRLALSGWPWEASVWRLQASGTLPPWRCHPPMGGRKRSPAACSLLACWEKIRQKVTLDHCTDSGMMICVVTWRCHPLMGKRKNASCCLLTPSLLGTTAVLRSHLIAAESRL